MIGGIGVFLICFGAAYLLWTPFFWVGAMIWVGWALVTTQRFHERKIREHATGRRV